MSDKENLELELLGTRISKEQAEAESAKLELEKLKKERDAPFWEKANFIRIFVQTFLTISALSTVGVIFYTYAIKPALEYENLKAVTESFELKQEYQQLIIQAKKKEMEADSLRRFAIAENRKLGVAMLEQEKERDEIVTAYKEIQKKTVKLASDYRKLSTEKLISDQERRNFKQLYEATDSTRKNLEKEIGQMTQKKKQAELEHDRVTDSIKQSEKTGRPEPGTSYRKNVWRERPLTALSVNDVTAMLAGKGFFDRLSNAGSEGIENQFESKKIKNDKIIFDRTTGLTWQQSGSSRSMTYAMALQWIGELNQLGYAGHVNWRLPTVEEALTLMEPTQNFAKLFIDPRFDDKQPLIWTADKDSDAVWYINFSLGLCDLSHVATQHSVRAVRTQARKYSINN